MKIKKTANKKTQIKISKEEWRAIGKIAGWAEEWGEEPIETEEDEWMDANEWEPELDNYDNELAPDVAKEIDDISKEVEKFYGDDLEKTPAELKKQEKEMMQQSIKEDKALEKEIKQKEKEQSQKKIKELNKIIDKTKDQQPIL